MSNFTKATSYCAVSTVTARSSADLHDKDCWHLPLIGVDVMHQGKGHGSALMRHAVDVIDKQGALGYLDPSNPRNVLLYEILGSR